MSFRVNAKHPGAALPMNGTRSSAQRLPKDFAGTLLEMRVRGGVAVEAVAVELRLLRRAMDPLKRLAKLLLLFSCAGFCSGGPAALMM